MSCARSPAWACLALALLLPGHSSAAGGAADVAFVSIRTGDAHIFRTRPFGGDIRLTQDGTNNNQPSWSPDGRLIAYTSNRSGGTKVYVMHVDGSNVSALTQDDRIELAPVFSPDGRAIAFYSQDPSSGRTELRIVSLAGDAPVAIRANGKDMGPTRPSWSADGRRVAFLVQETARTSEAWIANRDGSDARKVSGPAFGGLGKADPAIAPDGRSVVYVADMRGSMHLVLTDVVTGASKDLTPGSLATHENPRWSKDGRWIAFASTRDDPARLRSDVFVMRPDGSDVRNLTRDPGEDFNPHWSADGRTIFFTSLRTGTAQLFAVDVETGATQRITHNVSHDMEHTAGPVALR